jgi:hypothetical protein
MTSEEFPHDIGEENLFPNLSETGLKFDFWK